jgi:hypothetical protein
MGFIAPDPSIIFFKTPALAKRARVLTQSSLLFRYALSINTTYGIIICPSFKRVCARCLFGSEQLGPDHESNILVGGARTLRIVAEQLCALPDRYRKVPHDQRDIVHGATCRTSLPSRLHFICRILSCNTPRSYGDLQH